MQDIWVVECGGSGVMLLTETKIHSEAYSHNIWGYDVTCSKLRPSRTGSDQGSLCLVTREHPGGWRIESMRFHGPNVVRCKIVTKHTRTPLLRVYLTPSALEHLPEIEEAIHQFEGRDPIFLVDLNVDLDNAPSSRRQRMAYLLTEYNLIGLIHNFRQRRRF